MHYKKPSLETLNELLTNVEQHGYRAITKQQIYQSNFARIIGQYGVKTYGKILSYGDAVARLKKVYGEDYITFTRKEYNQEYNDLLKMLRHEFGKDFSFSSFESINRARMMNTIKDAIETEPDFQGLTIRDIETIPTDELNQIFKRAASAHGFHRESDGEFYKYLYEEIISAYPEME